MSIIWLMLSALCLVYYLICADYAGIGSSFIFIWIIGAVFFLGVFIVSRLSKSGIIPIPVWVKNTFMGIVLFGVAVFIIVEGMIISGMLSRPKENCDYVIVLGAQVRGTTVSKSLRYRLDAAYEYAEKNRESMIIVSGGQGKGEDVSEAYAMKEYLVGLGIDENRILMEDRSVDTSENIKFSKELIGDDNVKLAIATSDFHIYRSILLAKGQGFSNVSGIPSKTDSILKLNYMVREFVGILKDAVMGNF